MHGDGGGGETHGDRILDLDIRPPVSSEATPVCDVFQHFPIWVLCLAVYDRKRELEGCFRVACECDVARFAAADFGTCRGVPGLCAAKGFV